jgi:hypothetical protein
MSGDIGKRETAPQQKGYGTSATWVRHIGDRRKAYHFAAIPTVILQILLSL